MEKVRAGNRKKQPRMTRLGREVAGALQEVLDDVTGRKPLKGYLVQVPERIDVAQIRRKLRLSQRQFAERFGFDVRAVQDWEQGRRQPERSARVLLKIIDREPKAVDRALAA